MNKTAAIFFIFLFLLFQVSLKAQNCFEINRILVDACGSPEGENEMVFFTVGNTALNTSSLIVTWANVAAVWQGLAQNQQTQQKTAALNATIQACGFLIEPVGGNLPPFSKVLLITSEDMNPSFNSFAGLTDTVYVIFQATGNTAGHFKNYPSPNPRTLTMSFGAGCSDVVSYIPDLLIDQTGLNVAADGATVEFDAAGTATYTNPGCQAPVNVLGATISSSDSTVCAGDVVTLSANNITGNYLSYFWVNGNGTISSPGDTTTQYQTSTTFTGTDVIQFALVGNCLDTVYYPISIQIGAGTAVSISVNGPTSICQGDSTTLTASAGASYIWSNGSTSQSIIVSQPGTYIVTVSGACGSDTASVTIGSGVVPTVNIVANGPVTFCQGDSVTLTATGTGSFLWNTGSTSNSITVFQSSNYYVVASNSCGTDTAFQQVTVTTGAVINISASGPTTFCLGDSVTLTASGGASYLWSTGQTTASIVVSTANIYTVTGNSSCGSNTASVQVIVNQPPVASITANGPTTFCQGSSVVLTATGGNSYVWSTGATSASITINSGTLYTVTVTNNCGSSVATQSITVNPLPVATITTSGSTALCQGDSIILTANGGVSYLWSTGVSSNTIITSIAGNYIATATNSCGIDTASISVTVNTNAVAQITSQTNPLVLCPDQTLLLTATADPSYTYLWSSGATTSSIQVSSGGNYVLTVSNSCGIDSTNVSVTESNLIGAATVFPDSGLAPLNVVFANNSINSVSSLWNFGDGNSSTEISPQHTYSSFGNYTATLTVTDSLGCSKTLTFNIFADEIVNFEVPNIFTPNGDGINDNFEFIVGKGIKEFEVSVFNRWGNKIIENITSGGTRIWNGKDTDNNLCSPGSYFYKLLVTTVKGETINKHGIVELVK